MQEVSGLPMRRSFISVPLLAIRAITEPVGIHQDSPHGSGMGQSEGDPNIGISRQSVDPGRDKGSMRNQYVLNLLQNLGALIKGQLREVLNNTIPVNHTSRNGDQHQINITQGAFDQDQGSPTRGHAVNIEVMEVEGNPEEASKPEPAVLEELNGVMERAVILARNIRAINLYRLQRHSMGNCCGSPLLLYSFEHTTEQDAHQYKGATGGTLCSEAQEGYGQVGVNLFRKHNHTLVHQEFRKHNLLKTIGDLRTDLVTLPENQNPSPSNIRFVTSEPCG
ncbi:hypothetical protein AYI70_g9261 [Smittium culicis]|uniref:Uncharacterized protein n=1 Tax=Smittium culicis TaxID=133412 RepID=A0A1R1XC41_9FUNG|nr:hypothetical protein AYI70_g9261 [Smittium culicis]